MADHCLLSQKALLAGMLVLERTLVFSASMPGTHEEVLGKQMGL